MEAEPGGWPGWAANGRKIELEIRNLEPTLSSSLASFAHYSTDKMEFPSSDLSPAGATSSSHPLSLQHPMWSPKLLPMGCPSRLRMDVVSSDFLLLKAPHRSLDNLLILQF